MCKSFIGGNAYDGYTEEALVSQERLRPGCMSDTWERRAGRRMIGRRGAILRKLWTGQWGSPQAHHLPEKVHVRQEWDRTRAPTVLSIVGNNQEKPGAGDRGAGPTGAAGSWGREAGLQIGLAPF